MRIKLFSATDKLWRDQRFYTESQLAPTKAKSNSRLEQYNNYTHITNERFWQKNTVFTLIPIRSFDLPDLQISILDKNCVSRNIIVALEMLDVFQVHGWKRVLKHLWGLFLRQAGKPECKNKNLAGVSPIYLLLQLFVLRAVEDHFKLIMASQVFPSSWV